MSAEQHASLVRLVEAWNRGGRNPFSPKMQLTPEDAKRFSPVELAKVFSLQLAGTGATAETERLEYALQRASKLREAHWWRATGGLYWYVTPGENFRDFAASYAAMLLTNPLRGKLSDGPCQRPRCAKWFIKRLRDQKQCSARCTGIVQSRERTAQQRRIAHEQALTRAKKVAQRWKPTMKLDWKEFVVKEARLTSTKWLTRAINKGELQTPITERST